MQVDIRRVDDPDLIQQIGRLRAEVWRGEQPTQPSLSHNGVWLDELDQYAHTHQYAR